MASIAELYQRDIGIRVADLLGAEYRFFKSKLELRAETPDGHNVIVLSGSNKYSPYISLSFYFGRNFARAKQVEQLLDNHRSHYHIQHYSLNRSRFNWLSYEGPYTWDFDITTPPPTLASEVAAAIRGIAYPFFERFSTIEAARDAIATDDPWCFGGTIFWRQLLLLDLAMDDLAHFIRWAEQLDDFQRNQANEMIAMYQAAKQNTV